MGTSSGQARATTSRAGSTAAMARWYAPEPIVASVPMTPMARSVAATAAAAPGRITSTTPTGQARSSGSRAAAEAVLHATTTSFGSNPSRKDKSSRANRRTVSRLFVP